MIYWIGIKLKTVDIIMNVRDQFSIMFLYIVYTYSLSCCLNCVPYFRQMVRWNVTNRTSKMSTIIFYFQISDDICTQNTENWWFANGLVHSFVLYSKYHLRYVWMNREKFYNNQIVCKINLIYCYLFSCNGDFSDIRYGIKPISYNQFPIQIKIPSNLRNYQITTMCCRPTISRISIWYIAFIFEWKFCTISYSNHIVFGTCDGIFIRPFYIDLM